jgi:hypothetical protein
MPVLIAWHHFNEHLLVLNHLPVFRSVNVSFASVAPVWTWTMLVLPFKHNSLVNQPRLSVPMLIAWHVKHHASLLPKRPCPVVIVVAPVAPALPW